MISVIVPVYNVEQYLLRCLESIARQTFKDFEVILVDDGSTDQSGQICDKFCQTNHNFKCIHQENQGLSEARNKGLYYAKGDYFCFIDSDDYVHPRMLEVLFHATNKTNSDISMVGIQETNGMLNFREINEKEPRIIYQEEMLHSIFKDVGIYLFHIV